MTLALPIINLGNLYANNLQVSWVSTTTLSMAAGQCRDSTDSVDLTLSTATTINGAVNGVNGLDTGSLANNTWYAVYIIGSSLNSQATATLLSTSATAPALPSNYDCFRRIGWVLTDGSAHFLAVNIYGNSNQRIYMWDAIATELSAAGNASYTDVDLSSSVPSTSTLVHLNWKLVPNTAGNLSLLRKNGSSSTTNPQLTGSVAAQPNAGFLTMNCDSSQIIEYKTASASDALTLYVIGFTDFI